MPPLPHSYSENKIGKPKEEIENLNGFEYMYFSDLKVSIFLVLILHIHKSYFHGYDTLTPSHNNGGGGRGADDGVLALLPVPCSLG